ncbi:MAG: hypothetical protein OXU29_02715, partial [Gammaproteobacteria bacterium]|nr:hypothetical protein [Gammaproteobacteria bacterium]MDD9870298.1 hypothetical protein [Gammaproteobacteria bacterium]
RCWPNARGWMPMRRRHGRVAGETCYDSRSRGVLMVCLSSAALIFSNPSINKEVNEMHLIFILLHIAAILFFMPALFVTIPLHVICAVLAKR